MKKIIAICLLIISTTTLVFAEEKGKFEHKKGDMSLSIDATPFLKYTADLLNFSGGNPATSPTFGSFQSDVLGKYFIKNNAAVRVRLGISLDNVQDKFYVRDDQAFVLNPLSVNKLIDHKQNNKFALEIGLGYEYRLGKPSRVQGYAGGEVFFGSGKSKESYSYGNEFSSVNPNPTTSDFVGGVITPNQRTLSKKSEGNITYGAAGFIGVEIYITPQISIGGEIRLEFRGYRNSQTWIEQERWDGNTNTLIEETLLTKPKTNSFSINGQNRNIIPTVGLNIGFHF